MMKTENVYSFVYRSKSVKQSALSNGKLGRTTIIPGMMRMTIMTEVPQGAVAVAPALQPRLIGLSFSPFDHSREPEALSLSSSQ